MSKLIIARGCDTLYFDCMSEGARWDFMVTAEDLFPSETINASTWMAISGCNVSDVVVDDIKIVDGISYSNVVTARIDGFTAGVEAVTQLDLIGDSTAQKLPYEIRIPVAS